METTSNNLTFRMNQMYKYAIANGIVNGKTQFAEFLQVQPGTLSRYLSGKQEPSTNSMRRFNVIFGNVFNELWLITGKGAMLASQEQEQIQVKEHTPTEPVGCEAFSSAIHELIVEMRESRIAKDEQIDRLLTIIENMQKN